MKLALMVGGQLRNVKFRPTTPVMAVPARAAPAVQAGVGYSPKGTNCAPQNSHCLSFLTRP